MKLKARWNQYVENDLSTFKNLLIRTVILAILTFGGLYGSNAMVESGMTDKYSLVRLFPDFIPMMLAAAKLTFIEMSVCWIRFATRPKPNANQKAYELKNEPMAPASGSVVYVCTMMTWAIRVAVFIYLIG